MSEVNISQLSADFVVAFADLSKRLVDFDVLIDTLKLYYGGFGSWELVVTKEDKSVRFFYDGKDHYIQTAISPIRKWSSPNEWNQVEAKAIPTWQEAISYSERFLRGKFGKP